MFRVHEYYCDYGRLFDSSTTREDGARVEWFSIVIVGADSVRVSRQSVSIARMKKTTTRVKRILGKRLNIIFLLNSPKVSDL